MGRLRDFAAFLHGKVPEHDVSVVSFGKYAGTSFQDVLDQDPDYCHWILEQGSQEDAGFQLRQFAAFLDGKVPEQVVSNQGGTGAVSFGKYAGTSFQTVLDQDPDYCRWVLEQGSQEDARFGMKAFAA